MRKLTTPSRSTEPPSEFRLAVVGSRDWSDARAIWDYLAYYQGRRITIVTGGDHVRSLAEKRRVPHGGLVDHNAALAAVHFGFDLEEYPAEWDLYGKRAGPLRNGAIVSGAHAVVAFWDGRSSGTASTLRMAWNQHLAIRVIFPDTRTITMQRQG